MQIIERSIDGLRSARITLAAPGKPAFTLFPMIHVADPGFFARVRAEAARHDLILYEGVQARPARVANLSYRLISAGRSDLAFQGDAMRPVPRAGRDSTGPGRAVLADMDGAGFTRRWRRLPLWLRIVFLVMMPLAWLVMRFTGARKWLNEAVGEVKDSDTVADLLPGDGALGELCNLLLTERDAVLAQHCDQVIAAAEARTIAVVWGAAHMPALIRHLRDRHGYRPARSAWMTAVAAAPGIAPERPRTVDLIGRAVDAIRRRTDRRREDAGSRHALAAQDIAAPADCVAKLARRFGGRPAAQKRAAALAGGRAGPADARRAPVTGRINRRGQVGKLSPSALPGLTPGPRRTPRSGRG